MASYNPWCIHLCECGCGQPTRPYSPKTHAESRRTPQPRFLPGHAIRLNRLSGAGAGHNKGKWRNTPARFWARFTPGPIPAACPERGSCRLWTGAKTGEYGLTVWHGKRTYTHRLAWELTNGPVPPGLDILHHCDVPACGEPSHLYAGTQSQNSQDMWDRGRFPRAWSPATVATIRCRYQAGETLAELGAAYQTTLGNIEHLVLGRTYADAPGPIHTAGVSRARSLAPALGTLRQARGIGQGAFARRLGLDWGYYNRIEHGRVTVSRQQAASIAAGLGVPLGALWAED